MPIMRIGRDLHYFAHIPKCAGQAIEAYMLEKDIRLAFIDNGFFGRPLSKSWPGSSPQHAPWAEVSRLIPEDWFETSFAVVRNPLTRFVSAYNHRLFARNPAARSPALMTCTMWWRHFESVSDRVPFLLDNHLRKQSDFVPPNAEIFQLEDGLDPVAWHISNLVNTDPGGGIKIKDPASNRIFGSAEMVKVPLALQKRLIEYYKEDFERFGYDAKPIDDLMVYRRIPAKLTSLRGAASRLRALWHLAKREAAIRRLSLVWRIRLHEPPAR